MKKALAFIMAFAMMVSVTSCGTTDTGKGDTSDKETSSSEDKDKNADDESSEDSEDGSKDDEDDEDSKKSDKKDKDKDKNKGTDLTELSNKDLYDYLIDLVKETNNYRSEITMEMDMDIDMVKILESQGMSLSDMTAEDKKELEEAGISLDKPANFNMKVKMSFEADEDTIHTLETSVESGAMMFGTSSSGDDESAAEAYVDLSSYKDGSYTMYESDGKNWTYRSVEEDDEDMVSSSILKPEIIERSNNAIVEKDGKGYKVTLEMGGNCMDMFSGSAEGMFDDIDAEVGFNIVLTIENDKITAVDIDTSDFVDEWAEAFTKMMDSQLGDVSMEGVIKFNKFDVKMSAYDIGKVEVDIPEDVLKNATKDRGNALDGALEFTPDNKDD